MTTSSKRFVKAPPGVVHDLVIVGAGPAGLSAFVQARRQGLRPLVVESQEPGGAVRAGRRVENYPGIAACSGPDLAGRMTAQAEGLGLGILRDRVESLLAGDAWALQLASGRRLSARAVILATGQKHQIPDSLRPLREAGSLISPGAFDPKDWRGRRVLVVGGGDVAFDQALLLRDHGAAPEIVCRSRPRALPALQREARDCGIAVRSGYAPVRSSGGPPPCVTFANTQNPSDNVELDAECVLVAVGKRPDPPDVFRGDGRRIKIGARPAPHAGLFLAGDLWRGNVRQAAVAAGDGCAAAIAVFTYLAEEAAGERA